MAVWPASLPAPAINSLNETPPENTIRSNMDKGPPQLRRRTTANVRPISFNLLLTPEQTEILDAFYNDDTFSGSERFNYTHPRTGAACEAIFASPPSYTNVEGVMYSASVSLEILPNG